MLVENKILVLNEEAKAHFDEDLAAEISGAVEGHLPFFNLEEPKPRNPEESDEELRR